MAKEKIVKEEGKSILQETIEKLNKQYGVGTILSLNDRMTGNYDIISSGSVGIDYITLGIGGYARGKVYELMGWEGVGKSTICGHAVAECQQKYKDEEVLYVDGEHAVDKVYFETLGVDTNKMLISQPSCGEEGFQIAMELIKTKKLALLIIDSDSSLIPKKVLEGEVGDSSIGRKAWLNSNAYPKLKSAASENNVCVIITSQYRDKIGVMYGDSKTTQGGNALKFYADCRIEVTKSLVKEGDEVIANLTKVKSIKNKMCPPFRKSEFNVKYGVGIDKITEIIDLASDLEIIKKWGKSVTFNDVKYDVPVFNAMLEDNREFFDELKKSVIDKIKNTEIKIEEDVTSED
jgi:recombination protein RecA